MGFLSITSLRSGGSFDTAISDGKIARVLVETEEHARLLARRLAESAPGILTTWVEPQHRVDGRLLVTPDKTDSERDAVVDAWQLAGGSVERLARFWDPPPLPRERVRLYGPDTFALVVAQKLGIDLAEPDPYALLKCPAPLVQRAVAVTRLGDAGRLAYPCFLKPVVTKQFAARVFASLAELHAETQGLDDATEIVHSEIVTFVAEARSFVLDGVVQTCALYEGDGSLEHAAQTCERVAMALDLPRASVVDVGLTARGEWVFIEANGAWGAGLNGCDAHSVIACIAHASTPTPTP